MNYSEGKSSNYSLRKKRERTPVNLDRNVITKSNDDNITNENHLAVNTPNNLLSALEENRKQLPKLTEELKPKTNDEKEETFNERETNIENESRITDNIVSMTKTPKLFGAFLEEEVIIKLSESMDSMSL